MTSSLKLAASAVCCGDFMREFRFEGRLPSSKSLMNRYLVLKSYEPKLRIEGASLAEDVLFMRKAVARLGVADEFYCGEGGTTFRFFSLRVSRLGGEFNVKAHPRLFQRPQKTLDAMLAAFGVKTEWTPTSLKISSQGWKKPAQPVRVPADSSSQFASALMLNAWDLPFDLEFVLEGETVSEPYWTMTLEVLKKAGLRWKQDGPKWTVPAGQKPSLAAVEVEQDVSSAFVLAAAGALGGETVIESWPAQSLQADAVFVSHFKKMGIGIDVRDGNLYVARAKELKPLQADLRNSPDLLPVLATVAAFAKGDSSLRGAPQLKHKESDRIRSVAELLRAAGVDVTEHDDGLTVHGKGVPAPRAFAWNPDHDHRIAMSVGLLNSRGFDIRLTDEDVVKKSFPEFFKVMNQGPFVVVGHRGTGKTSQTKQLAELLKLKAVDLDETIAAKEGRSVSDIFAKNGEETFRNLELQTWSELKQNLGPRDLCVMGAGFRIESADRRGRWTWFRRDSDEAGRVFTDRPALLKELSPLEEFAKLFRHREVTYKKYSQRALTWPEGGLPDKATLEKIWNRDWSETGGVVVLGKRDLDDLPPRGPDFYELRNDVLDEEELLSLFAKLPAEKVIYSWRDTSRLPEWIAASNAWLDWALELGYPDRHKLAPFKDRLILSSHADDMKGALLDFKLHAQTAGHLKLCPLVETWEDLRIGHLWWSQDPARRSFLPRSSSGRWAWYRQRMKGRQKLGFWREGEGNAADQPTLWQWLRTPMKTKNFAAVLGSPVRHSWTPWEHDAFFAGKNMPVFAIDIDRAEWDVAISFLNELGLQAAAVTSPLKEKAAQFVSMKTEEAERLESVNTLWKKDETAWIGHNTDLAGLREAARDVKGPVVVWGGGGTLPVLRDVFPDASEYSATHGSPREGHKATKPTTLVWAAPRTEPQAWPPGEWKPDLIFDLNYKEDSPGRDYAQRTGARYQSGAEFFKAQAKAQREFWTEQRRES